MPSVKLLFRERQRTGSHPIPRLKGLGSLNYAATPGRPFDAYNDVADAVSTVLQEFPGFVLLKSCTCLTSGFLMTVGDVPPDFYQQAFQRNLGLITAEEQEVLRNACVAVAGVGGVGGLHLLALARMGVGRFHLADFDTFEVTNFNRQFGAMVDTVGRQKIDVMREMVRGINPGIDTRLFPEGVQPDNIDRFLEDVQVVVDGLDFFVFDHRRLLFTRARAKGLYVLTSGPVGFGSTLQIFSPQGMSFDEYFGIHDGMTEFDKFVAFATGLAPAVLHRRYMDLSKIKLSAARAPVVAASCILSSALVATETVNILLRRRLVKAVPHYFQFDMLLQKYKKGYLAFGARNPVQCVKRFVLRRTMKRLFDEDASRV